MYTLHAVLAGLNVFGQHIWAHWGHQLLCRDRTEWSTRRLWEQKTFWSRNSPCGKKEILNEYSIPIQIFFSIIQRLIWRNLLWSKNYTEKYTHMTVQREADSLQRGCCYLEEAPNGHWKAGSHLSCWSSSGLANQVYGCRTSEEPPPERSAFLHRLSTRQRTGLQHTPLHSDSKRYSALQSLSPLHAPLLSEQQRALG